MKKPKILLLTLCASMAFGANADGIFSWFGKFAGDDGKASTVGNPAAKIPVAKFNIINKSVNNISSVVVVDAKGQIIYNSNFVCKLAQKCSLNITNVGLNSSLTLKFMNAKNELVAAYLISRTSEVNSAILDESWLGIYVFNQMVKTSNKNPLILNTQLVNAFKGVNSPDNTPDIFEELGLYFLAQNGGANETKFYTTLNQKLDGNQAFSLAPRAKSLAANSGYTKATTFNQQAVRSLAPTGSSPICDSSVQSTFGYIQNLAGFIPVVGDAFGAIFGIGSQVLSDACPTSMDPDIASKFAKIDSRLNMIDQQLNSLNYSVASLKIYVDKNSTDNVLLDMYDNESRLRSDYLGKYAALTTNSNLDSYVKQNANLQSAFKDSKTLRDLLTNMSPQITRFETLVSNDKMVKMKISLDNMCKDPSQLSGDIIANRIGCNMVITRTAYTIDLNAVKMKAMLRDEITVVNNALKSGNINNAWLKANVGEQFDYNGQKYDWDKAADAVDTIIDAKTSFLKNTLVGDNGTKLYKPLDGLSQPLQDSIKSAQCASGNLPAIKEWHTIHPNDSSNKTPYVVTVCDDGAGAKITSKYFYNKRDTTEVDAKVVNAMGVLVSERFFHGGSNNNYGYDPTFPWANSSILVGSENPNKYYHDYSLASVLNIPAGNPQVSVIAQDGGPSSINTTMLKANSPTYGWDKGYNKLIAFKPVATNGFLVNYMLMANSNDLFTIMRYTKGDYTYVWVMRTWSDVDNSGYVIGKNHFSVLAAPQCIANDCKVNNNGAKLEKLEFIDGTTIEWNKTKGDTNNYATQIPDYGNVYTEYTINVK